jgi:hypothetical protein
MDFNAFKAAHREKYSEEFGGTAGGLTPIDRTDSAWVHSHDLHHTGGKDKPDAEHAEKALKAADAAFTDDAWKAHDMHHKAAYHHELAAGDIVGSRGDGDRMRAHRAAARAHRQAASAHAEGI